MSEAMWLCLLIKTVRHSYGTQCLRPPLLGTDQLSSAHMHTSKLWLSACYPLIDISIDDRAISNVLHTGLPSMNPR